MDKDPEALDPATVRSVQQGSPIIFKEQLQSTAPQKVKDTAGYHRADLHRSGIEAQRRSELPTNSVGYLFTPRQTGAQTGSSWGVPMQEEETDRHTHFVESQGLQKHLQLDPVRYPTNRRPSHQSWGKNEVFRHQSTFNPNSRWGRPDEALTSRGYGQANADYDVAHSQRRAPYAQTAVPTTTPYRIGHQTHHDTHSSNNYPGSPYNIQRGPYSAKTALYMAASLTDGAARDVILREADAKELNSRRPGRAREAANLRMWSANPANTDLREVGPQTILKNIFGLEHVNNPAAEIFYSMLAL